MRFIWNFPDATNVESKFLGGHLVAPNAHVQVYGSGKDATGNFEGGIIAKSAETNAEAHFYPYNSYMHSNAKYSLDLLKFDESNNDLAGAVLGAYPYNGTDVASTPEFKITTEGKGANNLGIGAGKYVIKEVTPPNGYEGTEKEYYIELIELGNYKDNLGFEKIGSETAEKNEDVEYAGGLLVRVYNDKNFTEVKEEHIVSGLAVAENTYTVDGKAYTFTIGSDGNVKKILTVADDGKTTDVTETEKENFTFAPVPADKFYVTYNGEKIYPDANGQYKIGSDYYTIDIASDGTINSVSKNGNTESADGFKAEKVERVYTILYNGESITADDGYYTIEGDRYDIAVDKDGNITKCNKVGEELSTMGFMFRGDDLYYYDNTNWGGTKLNKNPDGTYVFNGKNIEVQYTEMPWGAGTIKSPSRIKYVDEPAPEDIVSVIEARDGNAIVAYKGNVIDPNLNISDKLSTQSSSLTERATTHPIPLSADGAGIQPNLLHHHSERLLYRISALQAETSAMFTEFTRSRLLQTTRYPMRIQYS